MLKRKILGALIGVSIFAATPVVLSGIVDMPAMYASAETVTVGAESFTVVPNDDGLTAVLTAYKGADTDIEIPSTVTVDDKTYTVTGIGDKTFYNKATITNIVLPDTVTSIGSNAFSTCSKLASVTIPDSVESIGTYAFYNCKLLTAVNIPTGISEIPTYAFYGCGLTDVTIPANVKTIGANAFSYCSNLVTVTAPSPTEADSYITIDANAFNSCPVLQFAYFTYTADTSTTATITGMIGRKEDIEIPAKINGYSVDSIKASAFSNKNYIKSVVLPEGLTSLGTGAFMNCTALNSINFPSTLSAIPDNAFNNCGFESITIPSTIKSIGANAFANCKNLVTVNVPDATTRDGYIVIASSAFNNCPNLNFSYFTFTTVQENNSASITGIIGMQANVIIPTKIAGYDVVTTGKEAFKNKTFIQSVVVPEGVRSLGTGTFYGCTALKSVTLPSTLTVISDNAFYGCTGLETTPLTDPNPDDEYDIQIVEVGNFAFKGCTGLTSVQFPDSLNKIGTNAFEDCTGIETISMPNSIRAVGAYAFQRCTGLTTVQLSDSIRELGDFVFQNCTKLNSVHLPTSITTIPKGTFAGCTALTNIVIPDNVTEIADGSDKQGAFQLSGLKTVTLSGRLQKIGAYAFADCTALEGIEMPNTVNTLGKACFETCSALSSLTLSESLTAIPERAFYECSSLKTVTVPDKVTDIGKEAFASCSLLSELTIPKNLEKIGDTAFGYCVSLKSIELPNTITTIGAGAFRSTALTKVVLPTNAKFVLLNKAVFSGCSYLSEITIPENVVTIGDAGSLLNDGTFYGCSSLTEITLPATLKTLGGCAFVKCSNLKSIVIPDLVTTVGQYAFYDCSSLADLTIGKGVTTLNGYAFEHCPKLTEVEIPLNVKNLGAGLFSGCENLKKLTTNANLVNNAVSYSKSAYQILFYSDSSICLKEYYGDQQNLVKHSLEEVVFNNGVTTIGDYSFGGAEKLKRITFSNTVTKIGIEAFYNCKELVFVNTIPRSVTEISDYAFSGCPNLKAIVIPGSVTTFGNKVFAGDTNLTIFGESGSAAEAYAQNDNENIPFVNIYQDIQNAKAEVVGSTVSLTWDKISDTIISNGQTYKIDKIVYHIYRIGPDSEKRIIADIENNSYIDKDVVLGSTYTYSVFCTYCFIAGNNEEYTIDSAENVIGSITVEAPRVKNVQAVAAYKQVTLTWDAVAGATSYRVYRADSETGTKTLIRAITTTTYTDTTATPGNTYYYFVAAYNSKTGFLSEYSDAVKVTVPAAPAAPVISAISTDGSSVTLTWNKVTGATSYRIYRADSATGTKTLLKGVATTTYTDSTVTAGKTYYYFVAAYDSVNKKLSNYSAAKSIKVEAAIAAPVISTITTDGSSVTLAWNKITGATSYRIYRADSATGAKTLLKGVATTTYTDSTVTAGKTYYYFVAAYDSVNKKLSAYSAAKSIKVEAAIAAPAISAISTDGSSVTLTWNKVTGATSYRIYRADSATGTKTLLKAVTTATFTDTTVTAGDTYYYFVAAYDSVNKKLSAYSTAKSIKVETPLAAPAISVISSDGSSVTLTWNKVTGATSYRIYRAESATGAKTLLKAVTTATFTDTTVTAGKTYYYFVAAYDSTTGRLSAFSAAKCITV